MHLLLSDAMFEVKIPECCLGDGLIWKLLAEIEDSVLHRSTSPEKKDLFVKKIINVFLLELTFWLLDPNKRVEKWQMKD